MHKYVIENLAEQIVSSSESSVDIETVVSDLEYYYENPLNINTATDKELQQLWVLSYFQIHSLLKYIHQSGSIYSVYELLYVDGFNNVVINQLTPFIKIEAPQKIEKQTLPDIIKNSNNNIYIKATSVIEQQQGYKSFDDSISNKYLGNRMALYTQYQMNYKKQMHFGFTMEKDPGEELYIGKKASGFDFYSAHFQAKDLGLVKNFVLGDYSVQFGQGLVVWSGFSTGKSIYVMNICKRASLLKKYSSSNESDFMRGAGVTLGGEIFNITAFASHKQIDASVKFDTVTTQTYFSSFITDGLHSTKSAIDNKHTVDETVIGANAGVNYSFLNIGISALANKYSHNLMLPAEPKNTFSFSGNENFNLGADYKVFLSNVSFFGEAAYSKSGGEAILSGALLNMHDRFKASVVYRKYSPQYQALYAGGFGETDNTANEEGVYTGIEINIFKKWKLTAYYDHFTFPWLKQSVSSPSAGFEYFAQTEYVPASNVDMVFRFRSKTKQQNSQIDDFNNQIPLLSDITAQSFRYHINYSLSEKIKLRNRVEYSLYSNELEQEAGLLMYQDIECYPFAFPLSLSLRYAYFDTYSYNSRIYAYESDVLYSYSVLPYYDTGTRIYVMLKYNIHNFIAFYIRYSNTCYAEKQIIGSGLDVIDGNTKSDIKAMLKITF